MPVNGLGSTSYASSTRASVGEWDDDINELLPSSARAESTSTKQTRDPQTPGHANTSHPSSRGSNCGARPSASASVSAGTKTSHKPSVPTPSPHRSAPLTAEGSLALIKEHGALIADESALLVPMRETFVTMSPGMRPAYVKALYRCLRSRPEEEWVGLAEGLARARLTLNAQNWDGYAKALHKLARLDGPSPTLGWGAVCDELAVLTPADRDRMVTACVQLNLSEWNLGCLIRMHKAMLTPTSRTHWAAFIDSLNTLCNRVDLRVHEVASVAVATLLSVDAHEWGAFASVLRTLCTGMTADASPAPVFTALSSVFATMRPRERTSLMHVSMMLCTRRMTADDRGSIIQSLSYLPPKERLKMPALCEPLREAGVTGRDFALNLRLIVDTPCDTRAAHRDRLLAAHRARGQADPRVVDEENVSVYARISKAGNAIEALQNITGPVQRDAALTHVRHMLERWRNNPLSAPASLRRTRAHASELDNAWRELTTPRQVSDFSDCLQNNPVYHQGTHTVGLGDLCAQVWQAIHMYTDPTNDANETRRERANLKVSLAMAMAQCIEDDGHRVCAVGVSQRLLQVLQGYFPGIHLDTVPPQQLVCQLTQEFADATAAHNEVWRDDGGPTQAELSAFARRCDHVASEHYETESGEYKVFRKHLYEYLNLTYDWKP